MRTAKIERKTAETDIVLSLNLDGTGKSNIDSGCGFLNHMLTLFASHSKTDLDVKCKGDTDVDYHHTVEDIGIALGMAFSEALGDKRGIVRYGDSMIPMDETLYLTAIDFSGRSYLDFVNLFPKCKVGDFDFELIEEFLMAFVREARCTLHLTKIHGRNMHHIAEGIFKGTAHAVREAVAFDPVFADEIPSTKGVL